VGLGGTRAAQPTHLRAVTGPPDRSESAPPLSGGHTLARGVVWIGAFRWSTQVLTWAVTLLVIRLLSPRDYGIVGMTTFFVALMSVAAEFGIGSALLALKELPLSTACQLHTIAIGAGALATLVSAAIAWPLSRYFHEPALTAVLMVLGVSFCFDGLRVVPVALLGRALEYRKAASVDLVRAITAALVVLFLAWRGAGYWALVMGTVLGSAAASLWVFRLRRVACERPRLASLTEPLGFCRHLLVGRVAYYGYQNSDFLVAGQMFGTVLLGQYNIAWTIASLPGEKLTNILSAATAPFFGSIQHDRPALASYYLRLTAFLGLVLWPVLFGFLAVADLAIPVILGEKWTPAVPVARALIFYAALQSVSTLNAQILLVTGRSRIGMVSGLLALALLPPAFYLGGRLGGLMGIAWAWAVGYPLIAVWPLRAVLQSLQIPLATYLGAFKRAGLMVLGMVAGVLAVRRVIHPAVSAPAELAIAILAGALLYGMLCLRFARQDIEVMLRSIRGR